MQAAITSERTIDGFSRIELLINNLSLSPAVQSGFESEDTSFAPDVAPMVLNWTGSVIAGQTISITAQSSNGDGILSGGNFPTIVGSQFTVLLF